MQQMSVMGMLKTIEDAGVWYYSERVNTLL